jgi:hypothetical protein
MTETATKQAPPVALPHVDQRYHRGVLGAFGDVVGSRIEQLRAEPSWSNSERLRFFEHLLATVDADRYRCVQDLFLRAPYLKKGFLKYLDPVRWVDQKFQYAHLLGLHNRRPMRILDIGTGPGHFLLIARFYGHDAIGTDLPSEERGEDHPSRFYDALGDVYGTKRIPHQIRPYGDLSGLPGKFQLVTAFSVAFSRMAKGNLWGVAHWQHFLRSAREFLLEADGRMLLTVVRGKLTDETSNFLDSLSDSWPERNSHEFLISDWSKLR